MKLVVSACLLGQKVRYDGGDKRLALLTECWDRSIECLPLCPETEAGLPTPREPMDLFMSPEVTPPQSGVRAIGLESNKDYTDQLEDWCRANLPQLDSVELMGFVLKSRSPSCGLKVAVAPILKSASDEKRQTLWGRGLFAKAISRRFPLLPVAEEYELEDRAGAERFLAKLFILRRWRERVEAGDSIALQSFHSKMEDYLSSRSPTHAQALLQLAERAEEPGTQGKYFETLLALLEGPLTKGTYLGNLSALLDSTALALVQTTEHYFGG